MRFNKNYVEHKIFGISIVMVWEYFHFLTDDYECKYFLHLKKSWLWVAANWELKSEESWTHIKL